MKKIVFATGNQGKLREVKKILADLNVDIVSMKEEGIQIDVDENGTTFAENAQIKATAIGAHTDAIVLADDSGLVIDALNGEPGIYSARYLGEDTSYRIKNQNLIDRLEGVPDENENHELRDDDKKVRSHVQNFIDPAAAETAEQADKHADSRRNHASDQADIERGAQSGNQKRYIVAPQMVGSQKMLRTRGGIGTGDDIAGIDVHIVKDRTQNRHEKRQEENPDTDNKHRGLH